MFQKKCMVVGSLLLMAAQTAIAVTCDSITTDSSPNKAAICAQPIYTGELITTNPGETCASEPCDTGDAAACCAPNAKCDSFDVTACDGPVGYTGSLITDADTTPCCGATCLATSCDSLTPARTIDGVAVTTDSEICCAVKANCRTFVASNCNPGDDKTGALKPDNDINLCAGATCGPTDEAACCQFRAFCSTANAGTICTDSGDNRYSGALIGTTSAPGAADNTRCAGATCDAIDASTCCEKKPSNAKCSSIGHTDSTTTICGGSGLNVAANDMECAGATCDFNDKNKCCNPESLDGGGDDDDDDDDDKEATCSVTDGSKATPWTGGADAHAEPCVCTGARGCSTLNVCDVTKKTCVCTPGKDHWCYESAEVGEEKSYAVKFGCYKVGDNEFRSFKCDGDNVLVASYSDEKCTTHITPANGGEDDIFYTTKKTTTKKDGADGTVKTKEDTTTTGISTCKGGVAGDGAGAAAPGPAPGAAAPSPAPGPAGEGDFDAGSVAQCSTLAMLMVVAAMWAGRY